MRNNRLFSNSITPENPSGKKMGLTMLLVWLAWFYANLGANGLFYKALNGTPALRLPGEIAYFLGVSIVGIVAAYHFARKWNLDLPLFPKKRGISFWIGSLVFLGLVIVLGFQAMAEQNMTMADVLKQPFIWIIAPFPIFVPTMIAYTLLWYVFFLRGFEKLLGGSKAATAAAIILSAIVYGIYHSASIDEILTIEQMIDEIVITTLIGIGFGLYVIFARSLVIAFFVNWILNWFVFTPVATFHRPIREWLLPYVVLGGVWLVYRYWWSEK